MPSAQRQYPAGQEALEPYRVRRENLWEQVPLRIAKKNYKLEIRECRKSDIIEIDNFPELVAADPGYAKYPGFEEYVLE